MRQEFLLTMTGRFAAVLPRRLFALALVSFVLLPDVLVGEDLFPPRAAPVTSAPPLMSEVRHATHTSPEPARLDIAPVNKPLEKSIPLSAPPKNESRQKPSGGFGALVSVAGSLALVLSLFFVIAWLMKRGLPRGTGALPAEVVQVLGRTSLRAKQQLHVLRFGNKLLLVCVSATGVETLGEISDPGEIDRIAGLCQQGTATSASGAFQTILGQLSRETKPRDILAGTGGLASMAAQRRAPVREEVADG